MMYGSFARHIRNSIGKKRKVIKGDQLILTSIMGSSNGTECPRSAPSSKEGLQGESSESEGGSFVLALSEAVVEDEEKASILEEGRDFNQDPHHWDDKNNKDRKIELMRKCFPQFKLRSFTTAISAVQFLVFSGSWILAATRGSATSMGPSECVLFQLGGLWPNAVIVHNEIHRLLLPVFLHGTWIDLLMNVYTEMEIMYEYEQTSSWRIGVFYFLTSIGSSALYCLVSVRDKLGVGCTGPIYAMVGVFTVSLCLSWNTMDAALRKEKLTSVIINIGFVILSDTLEFLLFVIGFALGLLGSFWLLDRPVHYDNAAWVLLQNISLISVIFVTFAACIAVYYMNNDERDGHTRFCH